MPILEIRDLTRKYSADFSLDHISMELAEGDFAILFGEDDAGKSVLIQQILRLHHAKSGQILYRGTDMRRLKSAQRKSIRYVPDDVFTENITVGKYLGGLLDAYHIAEIDELEELCEYFGVELSERLPDMTYEGNKFATVIGALITRPDLLILDEPFNFLTKEGSDKLVQLLRDKNQAGMTILMTCEKYADSRACGNRYYYMKEGRILSGGEVPRQLGRMCAVTVYGEMSNAFADTLGEIVADRAGSRTYLYEQVKNKRRLSDILGEAGALRYEVEYLTLEELLDRDYSRWM